MMTNWCQIGQQVRAIVRGAILNGAQEQAGAAYNLRDEVLPRSVTSLRTRGCNCRRLAGSSGERRAEAAEMYRQPPKGIISRSSMAYIYALVN